MVQEAHALAWRGLSTNQGSRTQQQKRACSYLLSCHQRSFSSPNVAISYCTLMHTFARPSVFRPSLTRRPIFARMLLSITAATTIAAEAPPALCSAALSIFALTKTGSTFLGRFLKSMASRSGTCWIAQELRNECNLSMTVRCPAQGSSYTGAGESAPLSRNTHAIALGPRCCALSRAQAGNDEECASRAWIRTVAVSQTSSSATPSFVRGPVRLPPPQLHGGMLFPGRTNVVVVHYRHPIEAFVSLFYCVSQPTVCPNRGALRGNNSAPPESAAGGLDAFLLSELTGPQTTALNILLLRFESLLGFLRSARDFASSRADAMAPPLAVFESRYEHMVGDFPAWLRRLLNALPMQTGTRDHLHASLSADFKGEFVAPDGKHKHSLFAGVNLAKLQPATLVRLQAIPRVASVLTSLGYGWSAEALAASAHERPPAGVTSIALCAAGS